MPPDTGRRHTRSHIAFSCTSLSNDLEILHVKFVQPKLGRLVTLLKGNILFWMLASSRFVSCKISVIWSHCKSSCSWQTHLSLGEGDGKVLWSASLSSLFVYMYSRCLHLWNLRCRGGKCCYTRRTAPVIVHSIAYHVSSGRKMSCDAVAVYHRPCRVCGCLLQTSFYAVF